MRRVHDPSSVRPRARVPSRCTGGAVTKNPAPGIRVILPEGEAGIHRGVDPHAT